MYVCIYIHNKSSLGNQYLEMATHPHGLFFHFRVARRRILPVPDLSIWWQTHPHGLFLLPLAHNQNVFSVEFALLWTRNFLHHHHRHPLPPLLLATRNCLPSPNDTGALNVCVCVCVCVKDTKNQIPANARYTHLLYACIHHTHNTHAYKLIHKHTHCIVLYRPYDMAFIVLWTLSPRVCPFMGSAQPTYGITLQTCASFRHEVPTSNLDDM